VHVIWLIRAAAFTRPTISRWNTRPSSSFEMSLFYLAARQTSGRYRYLIYLRIVHVYSISKLERRILGLRRPGRTAILPPQKVVRCLMAPYHPLSLPLSLPFYRGHPHFCHPLLIAARGSPPPPPRCANAKLQGRLMPSFHHSVAVLPMPFRRSVLPFRCVVLPFRSYRCRCR